MPRITLGYKSRFVEALTVNVKDKSHLFFSFVILGHNNVDTATFYE